MTYGEIKVETAREICLKVKKECEKCPLRRITKAKNSQTLRLLFCNFVLRKLYEGEFVNEKEKEINEEEMQILLNEEVSYPEELKEFMQEHGLQ